MCGLTGFLRAGAALGGDAESILRGQNASLAHRGPDNEGLWIDATGGIALGHRRLAIIDLSEAGKQPMRSASGRLVLVYNGEIYNHLELRAELQNVGAAPDWRGHSDTETLLAGFEHWGVEGTLQRATGMFAIALWNRAESTLTFARDRMGEKPLFYGWQGDTLLFGSELKALRAHPSFRAEIDRGALAALLRSGYVCAPASIYHGIRKLPAGCTVEFTSAMDGSREPAPRAFWSLREVASRGLAHPFEGSDDAAIERLDLLLRASVQRQTISDVPLGAFLSGGIDSTTVVAMLQAQSSQRVRTFTIGFQEAEFDEARHAAQVARHLGTDHAELHVRATDALNVIPQLSAMYDEPFGDSSAIPTHLVARFARKQVTVCLSGDGGDELFGGYTRYQGTADLWRQLRRIPGPARRLISSGYGLLARDYRGQRMARYLAARDADQVYAVKTALWPHANRVVRCAGEWPAAFAPLASDDLFARMMYGDAMTYLPDDILAKVDRAAMAVSLETRIPLLDPAVVAFAWSLPAHMKVRDGRAKWLLRRVLARYVPESLIERPKMGFGIPVGAWMRDALRPWVEDLLGAARLEREGFFDAAAVRALWAAHLSGAEDAADTLWPVLMFQSWLATAQATPSTAVAA
ncbi:MAG: asparagine synthase (glutamine-hydrolyzing) [Pseudomonadota bacterium]